MNRKEWLEGKDDYKLCYIDGSIAYFTKLPLEKQWGDDWGDCPYEHNAEPPYYDTYDQIIKVAYDGYNIETPADTAGFNSFYSVEMINSGAVAWLTKKGYGDEKTITIQAGTNLRDFIDKIELMEGKVYVEI